MTEPRNPYLALEQAGDSGPARAPRRLSSVMLLGLSALLIVITVVCVSALRTSGSDAGFGWLAAPLATVGVGASIVVSALGVMRAVTLPLSRMPAAIRALSVFERAVIVLAHVLCAGLGALVTLFATVEFTRDTVGTSRRGVFAKVVGRSRVRSKGLSAYWPVVRGSRLNRQLPLEIGSVGESPVHR